ncbi:MAG: hypothetical protein ACI93N_000183 [Flavobacteriaceae bacterium]|jgi:hypothetical protein
MKTMKKITLFIAMLLVTLAYAQFPTISTDGNETWYYIQFAADGGENSGSTDPYPPNGEFAVIQDLGAEQNTGTRMARIETPGQLWKVSGTADNYAITSQLGNTMRYDYSGFLRTQVDYSPFRIIPTSNATYDGFEIADGDTTHDWYAVYSSPYSMAQSVAFGYGLDVKITGLGKDKAVLNFRLAADVVGGVGPKETSVLPTISTAGNDTWYHIKFRNGNGVLQDMGDGALLQTGIPVEDLDAQQWKISGTTDDYTLTCKTGTILDFNADLLFTTSSTSTLKISLVDNLPGWELQRSGETQTMNQVGGGGYGKGLAEWTVGDQNNPFDFVLPGDIGYGPAISGVDGNDHWYQIVFNTGGAIEDKGDEEWALTAAASGADEQIWKATGTDPNALTFTNALGRMLSFSEEDGRFIASSTTSVTFKVIATDDASLFNLQRNGGDTGHAINQNGGGGNDKDLAEWSVNDANNVLEFWFWESTATESDVITSEFPTISTDGNETWYYIQFAADGGVNSGSDDVYPPNGEFAVIQDLGAEQDTGTRMARVETPGQLWKVSGTADNYAITSKLGNTMRYDYSGFLRTQVDQSPFRIIPTSNATYAGFEIADGDTTHAWYADYSSPYSMAQSVAFGYGLDVKITGLGKDKAVLNFRLAADVVGGVGPKETSVLPTISTAGNDTWYHIKFRNGNGVLQDMGNGTLVKTGIPALESDLPAVYKDSQLWKISGTTDDYTLTCKTGTILDFNADLLFTTSSTSTLKISLVDNLPGWELQRSGETQTMNQVGGGGYGKGLAEWTVGDQNNPFDFVLPGDIGYGPAVSGVDGNDHWYQIVFNTGGAIEDKGDDAWALTAAASGADEQIWKATGTDPNALTFTNALGRMLSFSEEDGRFIASSTTSVTFKVIATDDASLFNLQRNGGDTGQAINQNGGGGNDKELAEWSVNDANNVLEFWFWESTTTLGVSTFDANNVVNVYPNPFKDSFNFNIKNTSSKNALIKVYSIIGQVVKSANIPLNNNKGSIDTHNLVKGIYIVEIETAEGKASFKMIKD